MLGTAFGCMGIAFFVTFGIVTEIYEAVHGEVNFHNENAALGSERDTIEDELDEEKNLNEELKDYMKKKGY